MSAFLAGLRRESPSLGWQLDRATRSAALLLLIKPKATKKEPQLNVPFQYTRGTLAYLPTINGPTRSARIPSKNQAAMTGNRRHDRVFPSIILAHPRKGSICSNRVRVRVPPATQITNDF